ncbi:hypothetical protein GDO81_009625 [Engystomops pustulosus]|uniref:Centrosomal protein 152 n=1 Tax=Engystomops pustulosus TaxID=76066 RepID=A0AAV7BTM1_ENGPU|nr:hypothetical protein GDO81_009625 [Engystomops pustulosus]
MSIDFDSGALQTQHDDEEYDKEDYAREQELQQLLTDLPQDLLDDSLCSSSSPNFSDCSDHELSEQHPNWGHKDHWENDGGMSDHQNYQNGYSDRTNSAQYMGLQGGAPRSQEVPENMTKGWGAPNRDKEENLFQNKFIYPKEAANDESNVGSYHSDHHYDGADHCSTSELYHLPEDFQPYTNNGHQMGEGFPDTKHEQFQKFPASDENGHQTSETTQLKYKPYQLNGVRKDAAHQDPMRRDDNYADLQREFLDTGECTTNNMQLVQLQVLYKARGRQLEELNAKLEESQRQFRYLSHQLTIVNDEKDGAAISLQESQNLLQNNKEVELQLRGQIAALEKTVEGLTLSNEQLRKEVKVSKLAMDSMQQQVMDLRRSDSIHRAKEQHEAVVSVLKKKNEEQLLSLQQKLDEVNAALTEQKEICSRLEQQVKLSERNQEEVKMEKTEIINRLTRSLEESQKQCANLLHSGSIQESTQLRMQLQQLQSSKLISDGMNKALQAEINELKEQITMYESAAKMGVFISGEEEQELSDSYVDLGIRKVNLQKSRFNRLMPPNGLKKDISSDEIIPELKAELERCLSSNKAKRQQISQLQSNLKEYQSKTEELKKLLDSAEKQAKDVQAATSKFDSRLESTSHQRLGADREQDLQRLQVEKQQLQQEVEKHLLCIKELATNEEKLKAANQQLCSEMRQMLEDFDKDKKESIERCERTYEQHHDDIRNHMRMELSERFEAEKEQLCQAYEMRDLKQKKNSYIHDLENQWRRKLDSAVHDAKTKLLQNLEDQAIQTEETVQSDSVAEDLEELKRQLCNVAQEKERAVREVQADLETRHREDISKQIESALTKAHTKWLGNLTSLSEYKANLRFEREKWERLHDVNVKKQIADAVAAAEENWKMRLGDINYSKKEREFEEQIASLKRELEQKNQEFEARVKVELGEARALWNKERQEEIQQIQAQNEKDYRTFLNEHRIKINEILSAAKADFEKQKSELVSQKEAELTESFSQQLKHRACEESRKIQDLHKEILSEIERLMSDIHDELIEKRAADRFSSASSSLDAQFLDRLRSCLQKSVKGIVYKLVSNAKTEWKQTCLQQLERYKKDCQELRSKLDKACRHLQQAVRDQKMKAEQFKNNEIVAQSLRKENADLHKTLQDLKSKSTPQSSLQEEDSEKGCALCSGNVLEEMRAQYIKAVDKIKKLKRK